MGGSLYLLKGSRVRPPGRHFLIYSSKSPGKGVFLNVFLWMRNWGSKSLPWLSRRPEDADGAAPSCGQCAGPQCPTLVLVLSSFQGRGNTLNWRVSIFAKPREVQVTVATVNRSHVFLNLCFAPCQRALVGWHRKKQIWSQEVGLYNRVWALRADCVWVRNLPHLTLRSLSCVPL